MPFFCSAAMYPLSRACEDCELVGPVMTAIRRCPNDMRYCVASIPPVQLSMPTPNASAETCPTGSTITYGMFLVCSSDSSADEIFDKRSMTPSGLRSMALRRQLLVSFLVEYSLKSGPAQLTVMPMPKSLAYEVVSLTISTDPLLVISLTTSSIDRMVLVVGSFLRNPASSRSSSTLSRVSSETPSRPLMTLDTVAGDTPAAWAISETFGLFVVLIVVMTLLFFVRDAAKTLPIE